MYRIIARDRNKIKLKVRIGKREVEESNLFQFRFFYSAKKQLYHFLYKNRRNRIIIAFFVAKCYGKWIARSRKFFRNGALYSFYSHIG